jgi:anti-anti-sigma regulatory factor
MQPLGGEILLQHPTPHIRRILKLAGMERIAEIQNAPDREVVQ